MAGALLVLTLAACTPEQVALFQSITSPTSHVLTDHQLHKLRSCESGNNMGRRGGSSEGTFDYSAVSRSGTYRGAYQFSRSTWDSVASRHYPWLVGMDPAATEWYWQDAMARALYSERGGQPWPNCGRNL